jgi:hypothetical protein
MVQKVREKIAETFEIIDFVLFCFIFAVLSSFCLKQIKRNITFVHLSQTFSERGALAVRGTGSGNHCFKLALVVTIVLKIIEHFRS